MASEGLGAKSRRVLESVIPLLPCPKVKLPSHLSPIDKERLRRMHRALHAVKWLDHWVPTWRDDHEHVVISVVVEESSPEWPEEDE